MMTYRRADLDKLNDEDELQVYLKDQFETQGWNVRREVRPDGSENRVDLILSHGVFGRIGVETKYVGRKGGDIVPAKGHHQITQQYWNETYGGDKIALWALCPYIVSDYDESVRQYTETVLDRRHKAARSYCNQYGIGYLELTTNFTRIEYAENVRARRIPAFPVESEIPPKDYRDVDIDAIRELVETRRKGSQFD